MYVRERKVVLLCNLWVGQLGNRAVREINACNLCFRFQDSEEGDHLGLVVGSPTKSSEPG